MTGDLEFRLMGASLAFHKRFAQKEGVMFSFLVSYFFISFAHTKFVIYDFFFLYLLLLVFFIFAAYL